MSYLILQTVVPSKPLPARSDELLRLGAFGGDLDLGRSCGAARLEATTKRGVVAGGGREERADKAQDPVKGAVIASPRAH